MNEMTITRARNAYASDFYNMLTKECANCDFQFCANDVVGLDNAKVYCVACISELTGTPARLLYKIIKVAIGCEMLNAQGYVCGFSEDAYALDGAHIDASTKYRTKSGKIVEPSDLFYNCSASVMGMELAKCFIACANHHRIATAKERGLVSVEITIKENRVIFN